MPQTTQVRAFSDTPKPSLIDPGMGWHKEQAELPGFLGGYNRPTLVNLHEPAAAGAMEDK